MSKNTASESSLGNLHQLMAEVLKSQLEKMQSGEIDIDTKILTIAVKFLKDNNIECTADEMKGIFKLEGITLPDFDVIAAEE